MPAEGGSSEVCEAEKIEGAAEGNAGDSIERRSVPCDLGSVDAEMWGDGTLDSLLDEDFVSFGGAEILGSCKSIGCVSK